MHLLMDCPFVYVGPVETVVEVEVGVGDVYEPSGSLDPLQSIELLGPHKWRHGLDGIGDHLLRAVLAERLNHHQLRGFAHYLHLHASSRGL